jgi:glutaredoxin 3
VNKKIIMYSKSYCPFCVKAKQLLKNKNQEVTEIDITNDLDLIEEMMTKSSGRKSVPQIFIGDLHVGGFDELSALNQKGELDKLLISS